MQHAVSHNSTESDGLPLRMSEAQAAEYLGFSPATLRKSRTTGQLGGVAAPKYMKLGRRVVYPRAELDAWLDQFAVVGHTSEAQGGAL